MVAAVFRARREGETASHFSRAAVAYRYLKDVERASWSDRGDIRGARREYLAREGEPGGGVSVVDERAREAGPVWARVKQKRPVSGYDRFDEG
jgi:hypothetical protein